MSHRSKTLTFCTYIVLCVMAVLLCSCVQRYPMGLSADDWNSLSPDKRAQYQAQQYAIDAQARQEREAQRLEQQRLAEEAKALEQNRIVAAYDRARYGEVVTVNISGSKMYYGKKIWPCEPVSFDLVKSESKEVQFTGYDPSMPSSRLVQSYGVSLSDDGHTFTFNHESFGGKVVLIDNGWRNGRTYAQLTTASGKRVEDLDISGMTITIRYRDVNDGSRVIIEHR